MDNNSESSVNKEDTSGTLKRELPSHLQKKCLVCGDKAFGYNFNAISCESCKAFFRRNALASKVFKCAFSNKCEITVVTRRFCQKCRLEKCLAVGMVKEFIMSEEDKAEKRKKIQENRAKKRQHSYVDDQVTSSKVNKNDEEISSNYQKQDPNMIQYEVLNSTTCSPNSSLQSPIHSDIDSSIQSPSYNYYIPSQTVEFPSYSMSEEPSRYVEITPMSDKSLQSDSLMDQYTVCSMDSEYEQKQQISIKSMLTANEQSLSSSSFSAHREKVHVCEELPSSSAHPHGNKARDILQDVERIEPNSMESILCEAIKLEFEAYTSVNPCSRSSRELNEVERAKLNELIVANKALNAPIDDDVTHLIGGAEAAGLKRDGNKHDPELITIVNLTAVAIRRLIKMSKRISAFRNMCEADQVALLKGGCTEMMVLRSTMTYDNQGNSWKIPHTQLHNIKTDVLKLAKGNIYRSHESFISSFLPRWRTDENIILVMSAILLFTPDRAHVVHSDVIKLEQNSYYYLLRRYLESVYPGCEAKSTFLKLIQKILELRKLAEEVTGVYLDVNPIEPLLMEIFDLKHHAV